MKSEYSRINFPELRKLKKEYKKNKNNYYEIFEKIMNDNNIPEKTKLYYYFINCFIRSDFEKVNYFIENNKLFEFFENTNINMPFKEITEFIYKYAHKHPCFSENGDYVTFTVCIKIFSKSIKNTILFNLTLCWKGDDTFVGNSEQNIHIMLTDGDEYSVYQIYNDKQIEFFNKTNASDHIHRKYVRLVLNLLFYISAYPDNVLDHAPDERIEGKVDPKKTKTITVSKEISDYLKDTELTPHLRRGHFRLLNSDYYKHKKGQVIFVRSSFVKGKAKTIIDNEKRNPAD